MTDIFAGIFDDLKGAYDDVSGFFDKSLEAIGVLDEDDEQSGFSKLGEAALMAFSPRDKSSSGVSLSEGQVGNTYGVSAGDTRANTSVDMQNIERQWVYRLREFSKVDGSK